MAFKIPIPSRAVNREEKRVKPFSLEMHQMKRLIAKMKTVSSPKMVMSWKNLSKSGDERRWKNSIIATCIEYPLQ